MPFREVSKWFALHPSLCLNRGEERHTADDSDELDREAWRVAEKVIALRCLYSDKKFDGVPRVYILFALQ